MSGNRIKGQDDPKTDTNGDKPAADDASRGWVPDGEMFDWNVPPLDDRTHRTLLRLLPATAWAQMAGIYDNLQCKGNEADDVVSTRKLLKRIVKHPSFTSTFKADQQKRQA